MGALWEMSTMCAAPDGVRWVRVLAVLGGEVGLVLVLCCFVGWKYCLMDLSGECGLWTRDVL